MKNRLALTVTNVRSLVETKPPIKRLMDHAVQVEHENAAERRLTRLHTILRNF